MLVVVARLQGVNQCCFKAATLFAILRRVGDEIQIACAVTSGIKRVGSAASVSRPQIVALADSQQIFFAVGLHVDARSRPKHFARLEEAGKALEYESHRKGKRLRGCTARIVPNHSAFRKRNDRERVQKSSMPCVPDHLPFGNQKRF